VFLDVLAAKAAFVGTRPFLTGEFPAKFRLMGVMHGHFDWPDIEPDVVADDGKEKLGINMGIAIVVPADKIVEVLGQFEKEEELEAEEFRKRKRSYIHVGSIDQEPNTTAQVTTTGLATPVPPKERKI
jgi:hypothetical protein